MTAITAVICSVRHAKREAIPIREWWEAIAAELVLPDEVDVPDELDDRAADSWEPLIGLAAAAGDEWAARGRHAAAVLSGAAEVEDDTLPNRLLAGIHSVFADKGMTALQEVAQRLPPRHRSRGWGSAG